MNAIDLVRKGSKEVQAPSDPSLLGLSWSQPHLSQRPFQAQQSRSSQQAGASRMMFGGKPEEVEEQEDV